MTVHGAVGFDDVAAADEVECSDAKLRSVVMDGIWSGVVFVVGGVATGEPAGDFFVHFVLLLLSLIGMPAYQTASLRAVICSFGRPSGSNPSTMLRAASPELAVHDR